MFLCYCVISGAHFVGWVILTSSMFVLYMMIINIATVYVHRYMVSICRIKTSSVYVHPCMWEMASCVYMISAPSTMADVHSTRPVSLNLIMVWYGVVCDTCYTQYPTKCVHRGLWLRRQNCCCIYALYVYVYDAVDMCFIRDMHTLYNTRVLLWSVSSNCNLC